MKKRIIFHVDANSAYLSWEAAYRLQRGKTVDLRDIPSVIGGNEKSRHGIVLTKSIPAKKYKIQTGESLFSARNKCPNLLVIPPNYTLYMQCSNAMAEVLKKYSSITQRYSIDEIFLDYTNMEEHFGPPLTAAHQIKEEIKNSLGFTVNIGIGDNKLLAKMASEFKKPDRVHTLFREEIQEKMWPLPVEELFMVGRATAKKLYSRGINTIGDLARTDLGFLHSWLKSHGSVIWNYAHGIENSAVRNNGFPMKGLGNSTTIPFDVEDRKTAHMILLSLVETVGMRLRFAKKSAEIVSISIKNSDFYSYSHQRKLDIPTDCTNSLYFYCRELFDEIWKGEPIRHLGVQLSGLCSNEFYQLSFFESEIDEMKNKSLDATIDKIRMKYGPEAIIRSSFLHSCLKPLTGGVIIEGDYPMMSSIL